jgi:hypothetical protein
MSTCCAGSAARSTPTASISIASIATGPATVADVAERASLSMPGRLDTTHRDEINVLPHTRWIPVAFGRHRLDACDS